MNHEKLQTCQICRLPVVSKIKDIFRAASNDFFFHLLTNLSDLVSICHSGHKR